MVMCHHMDNTVDVSTVSVRRLLYGIRSGSGKGSGLSIQWQKIYESREGKPGMGWETRVVGRIPPGSGGRASPPGCVREGSGRRADHSAADSRPKTPVIMSVGSNRFGGLLSYQDAQLSVPGR